MYLIIYYVKYTNIILKYYIYEKHKNMKNMQ